MSDDRITYKGASSDELTAAACKAVALLCDKDPELVVPEEDGSVWCINGSAGVVVFAESDPSALFFITSLVAGIKGHPALYKLINEINTNMEFGTIHFDEEESKITYFYRYPSVNPDPTLIAFIIESMLTAADDYDDRLKARLGGERFNEQAADEIDA